MNFVWVDKLSLQEEKVSILHLSVLTTQSESIPDGHNCRYIDQQHLNIDNNNMAYPEFSNNPEHIANISDSDDSLIEDKLKDTDHFNRQTFSSVATMLNYILCPYSECTFEKLKSCRGTASHKMIATYDWMKENLDTKFGCKQEGLARQISVRKFDGYLLPLWGKIMLCLKNCQVMIGNKCTGLTKMDSNQRIILFMVSLSIIHHQAVLQILLSTT